VYTGQGEVLLLNRVRPEGFWQSVTGSLEWDEQPMQAALRELFEETGIHSKRLVDCHQQHRFPILPEWRDRYAPDVAENTEHVFKLQLDAPLAVQLNPKEHSQYQWLPIRQAAEKVFSWTNRDAILALL
jgi:dATP pyrophosphohydrolase